jgi:hypothetical protein
MVRRASLAVDLGGVLLPFSVAANAAIAARFPQVRRSSSQLNFVTADFN